MSYYRNDDELPITRKKGASLGLDNFAAPPPPPPVLPGSGLPSVPVDRDSLYFRKMKEQKEQRELEKQEALEAKIANMTPEEREQYEQDKFLEEQHKKKKEKHDAESGLGAESRCTGKATSLLRALTGAFYVIAAGGVLASLAVSWFTHGEVPAFEEPLIPPLI